MSVPLLKMDSVASAKRASSIASMMKLASLRSSNALIASRPMSSSSSVLGRRIVCVKFTHAPFVLINGVNLFVLCAGDVPGRVLASRVAVRFTSREMHFFGTAVAVMVSASLWAMVLRWQQLAFIAGVQIQSRPSDASICKVVLRGSTCVLVACVNMAKPSV